MSKLAINGGPPVRSAPWPQWPRPKTAERAAQLVTEALTSGKWAGDGPMENAVAQRFAALSNAKFGVCTSSGTTALQTAFEAAGDPSGRGPVQGMGAVIGFGDEVIVPGMTWIATASAVLATNGVPVFADVDPETFCLDAKRLPVARPRRPGARRRRARARRLFFAPSKQVAQRRRGGHHPYRRRGVR